MELRLLGIPILILFPMLIGCGGNSPQDPPGLDPALRLELAAWLDAAGQAPEDYVRGLFTEHDVVFLGEQHRVQHDVHFMQALIAPLYEAGVHVLGTEFGRREDQELIDRLLVADRWDEDLARDIVFRQFIWWGYREYVDLYKTAWRLNSDLREDAPRFRILGLNDSPVWSLVTNETDRQNPDVMRKVWAGGGEELWGRVILDAVESGEKVLVHCGIHHAFTRYRQPRVANGEFKGFGHDLRCGNHIHDALGDRVVTVFLHAPWHGLEGYDSPMRHPADGIIDALMLDLRPRTVGFDLHGSPLAKIPIEDAVYRHGYPDFTVDQFCDGWIYHRPIGEYLGVTPIEDWFNEGNIDRARSQSPNPKFRDASIARMRDGMARDADIPRRWGHLR